MNPIRSASRRSLTLAILLIALVPVAARESDRPLFSDNIPVVPEGLDIVEKLGEKLPLELQFTDEAGNAVRLGDYFAQGKPVLFNLVYFECPSTCNLLLNGEVRALKQIDLEAGKDFQILTVSFNPNEKPYLAALKKANYIAELGNPKAAGGWAFLTGDQQNILALADAAGFRYRFNPKTKQYDHGAALMVLTPDGRFSRYFGSTEYNAKVVRLSLIEASGGKIGSLADQIFLTCFKYDSSKSAYVPMAYRIMQAGGAATVVVLAMTLAILWLIENKKNKKLNHVEPNPA